MSELEIQNIAEHSAFQAEGLTIGLLNWGIDDTIGHDMWAGVADAAREFGATSICFIGDFPSLATPSMQGVYGLAGPETLDGIILWSGLFQQLSAAGVDEIFAQYGDLGIVSAGAPRAGIPSVLVDNYQGMRDEIAHLIDHHGSRRIAFIRGPEGDWEADARYRAYVDVVEERHLGLDPVLVSSGDNSEPAGVQAMHEVLDERKLRPGADFDAVVGSNDNMTFGALSVLQERGIRVPYDVAVAGFDDIDQDELLFPVTTVRYSFYELGWESAHLLIRKLRGHAIPEQTVLKPELVIRRSCGCLSPIVVEATRGTIAQDLQPLDAFIQGHQDDLVSRLEQREGAVLTPTIPGWATQLLESLAAGYTVKSAARLLSVLDGMLRQTIEADLPLSTWQRVLSVIRSSISPALDDDEMLWAEDLWQQARVMVAEATQRAAQYRHLQSEQYLSSVRNLGLSLVDAVSVNQLMEMLLGSLHGLGVPGCYVSLYDQDIEEESDLDQMPEWSNVVLAYGPGLAGRVAGERFPTCQLLPPLIRDRARVRTWIVQGLAFQNERQGTIVYDVGGPGYRERDEAYSQLSTQVSNALHRVLLVERQERARAEAQESRQRLEEALEDLQMIQQRVVGESWGEYAGGATARHGYISSGPEAQDSDDVWFPAMTDAVRRKLTVVETDEMGVTLALPILFGGETIGAFGFQRADGGAWSEQEIVDVETVVSQVAQVLENQRLLDEELQARIALDEQVKALDCLNDIGRRTEETPPVTEFVEWVAGRIPSAMRHADVCEVAVELDGRVYGAVAATELSNRIVQGLRVGGKVVGRVYIAYRRDDYEFVDEESALLGDIARRVSGYVESQRLLQATQSSAQEAAVLYELGRALSAQLDMEQVLELIYSGVSQLVDASSFFIGLYDREREQVAIALDVTASEADKYITVIPSDAGLTGYMIRTGESLLIRGNVGGWQADHGIEVVGEASQCFLSVPLTVGDELIGVMTVQDFESPHAFDEVDQARMVAIANQAAVAIQNAKLFEQLQARARHEQILREITAKVRGTTDPDLIVRTAVRELGEALGRNTFVRLGSADELTRDVGTNRSRGGE